VMEDGSRYAPEASYTPHGAHQSFLALPSTALDVLTPSVLLAKRIYTTYANPCPVLRSINSVASCLLLCSKDEDGLKDVFVDSVPLPLLVPFS